MAFKHIYIFPIILGIILPATIITTFITSTSSHRVYSFFPYISDTGAWPPESCFFGIMLNFSAIIMFITLCVRHALVKNICIEKESKDWVKKWNSISFIIGCFSVLGIELVANFQDTVAFFIHNTGAALAFGVGLNYFGIQVLISFALKQYIGNKYINVLRLTCFIIMAIAVPIEGITGVISYMQFDGDDITKWTENYKGYSLHVISAISEWILIFPAIVFLFSFFYEFRYVTIESPKLNYSIKV